MGVGKGNKRQAKPGRGALGDTMNELAEIKRTDDGRFRVVEGMKWGDRFWWVQEWRNGCWGSPLGFIGGPHYISPSVDSLLRFALRHAESG